MPAENQDHIRASLTDRVSNLRNIQSAERGATYIFSRFRSAHDVASVAVGQRYIPRKGAIKAGALLFRCRIDRVNDGEINLGAVLRDVTEPRRKVLNRVRGNGNESYTVHMRFEESCAPQLDQE